MFSLRDAAFAVRSDDSAPWSLRGAANRPMWPVMDITPISALTFCRRYSRSGQELRALAAGTANAWSHVSRTTLVKQVRDRLRDPGIINQKKTSLCGPTSIVFELARRKPARYVKAVRVLLETGKILTYTDEVIEAQEDMLERELGPLAQVDWIFIATLREEANTFEDVEDGGDWEGYTLWGAMRDWTRDILGLDSNGWETCFLSGEIDVMAKLRKSLNNGGVAFMLIDASLLHDGGDDDEEEMWWRMAEHSADGALGGFGAKTHSEDDNNVLPDHWVPVLGGLKVTGDTDDEDTITVRVWSWAKEYELTGTAEALGEYLYAGAWGY